ncbi:anaerobic ribonucleoside-triphosphate reductase activating protein [Arcobacter sp. LA11]|uniref:anaerobic ribonucleoside-triphosphate reductase activating protein n=1 Tax=Arcobacter sp. LA11 TaxID=1898176 RepID=UPI002159F476|nr:anaerobic ribonucleoside-triphosphate reductase activating protein [Arcobacter sp. LA11]
MKNIIYSITKFTTTDYKDHLSCVVWFSSCNMRCLYCYNPDIVKSKEGNYSLNDLYSFLKKRIGLLDAVVLSGGEATTHDLFKICENITNLGFKIKLDTNGSNPKLLKKLLDNYLLDYVALDFKAPKNKYKDITKSSLYDEFIDSLKILKSSDCKFEVRTTLHNDLLDVDDINTMQKILVENTYTDNFYIQKFLEVENLSNLENSTKVFDLNSLNNDLNIVWRN